MFMRLSVRRPVVAWGLAIVVVVACSAADAWPAAGRAGDGGPEVLAGHRTGTDLVALRSDSDRLQRVVEWEKKPHALGLDTTWCPIRALRRCPTLGVTVGHRPVERGHRFAGRGPPSSG